MGPSPAVRACTRCQNVLYLHVTLRSAHPEPKCHNKKKEFTCCLEIESTNPDDATGTHRWETKRGKLCVLFHLCGAQLFSCSSVKQHSSCPQTKPS
ncbi:hypothetical protein AMELA_G00072400 [Ameiurus melas]|uniref:Uncharacterized protein n=1 Tax=Ameiurus melas TaxID=219545 RepID=A0A7J6AXI9_AMEME|nr:hypothetical protein AMELA_G00072400 [Ameiurus melas]